VNQQQIMRATAAMSIALVAWAGAAQAQSLPASERGAAENGPKSLVEAISGSTAGEKSKDMSGEEDRLEPDRPHLPEASTAVGKGRAVLESGYTFNKKDTSLRSHSWPEALLRVGMFSDWFEFRIGQSFLNQRQTTAGTTISANGAQDLYLGFKVAVTEQKGFLPAIAVIPQMTVPTGSSAVSAGKALPGVNVDFSWDVIKDLFAVEVVVANNQVQGDMRSSHLETAVGLTGVVQLTKKLEAFVEWDSFYPVGAIGPAGPRHYAVGGLVYFLTPNLAVDARAGIGLNDRSNDFLAGFGFAVRY
jgi:Putative MetA-pathway of phenol degradation